MRGGKLYGHVCAAIAHAGIIIVLSIAVVRVPMVEERFALVEPQKVEIGQQEILPPATSEVEPEIESPPPVGAEVEPMDEPNDIVPTDDPSLIPPIDVDQPKPIETLDDSAMKGLPGEKTPKATDADRSALRGPDAAGVPEMLGIPIEGETVFLVDLSGSMDEAYGNDTRYRVVADSLANAITGLRATDSFDVIAFSNKYPEGIRTLWGSTQLATGDRKSEAIKWLDGLTPDDGTPTLEALQYFSKHYPDSTNNLVLVTDGVPNTGQTSIILGSVERLLSRFTDLDFICISISSDGLYFVKSLVDKVGGVYVLVE